MALIKTTAVVDSISGKVQGSVFASNKGGAYMRGRGLMLNPDTNYQAKVRTMFTAVSQKWREIFEENRKSFIGATPDFKYVNRIGDTKEYTGKALYQKLNMNLLMIGEPMLDNAPAPAAVQGIVEQNPEVSITVDGTGALTALDFDWALQQGQDVEGSTDFLVEATTGLSMGRNSADNQYRVIGVAKAADLASPLAVTNADVNSGSTSGAIACYQKRFGNPSAGEKVFIRIKPINNSTGQAGVALKAKNEVF